MAASVLRLYDGFADTSPQLRDEVRELQARLRQTDRGIVVDGLFGHGTEQAVRDFQLARGLRTDGVVGLETWTALLDAQPSGLERPAGDALPPRRSGAVGGAGRRGPLRRADRGRGGRGGPAAGGGRRARLAAVALGPGAEAARRRGHGRPRAQAVHPAVAGHAAAAGRPRLRPRSAADRLRRGGVRARRRLAGPRRQHRAMAAGCWPRPGRCCAAAPCCTAAPCCAARSQPTTAASATSCTRSARASISTSTRPAAITPAMSCTAPAFSRRTAGTDVRQRPSARELPAANRWPTYAAMAKVIRREMRASELPQTWVSELGVAPDVMVRVVVDARPRRDVGRLLRLVRKRVRKPGARPDRSQAAPTAR